MNRYRGKSNRQSNQSNLEHDLWLKMWHAYSNGELKEFPATEHGAEILLTKKQVSNKQIDEQLQKLDEHIEELHEQLFVCRPDFLFCGARVPVFIDGPVHTHSKIAKRDQEITQRLEEQGYHPLRFPYRTNTKKLQDTIFNEIMDTLEKINSSAVKL